MESKSYEVFGKYILLEKLAAGGMAEVFLARSPGAGGIGKFVAVKRILPQFSDSPEFIDMFKDEAKIAINLSHSNIVSIYEFGVEKGQFFLVMDYVEGRNLRQILNKMKKSNTQFSIDQIVYVCKEVAAGLDHAHRCLDGTTGKPLNITHRDMSPQNVMVSYEGEVKIVDFGIAKAESQLETTRAGTLKGKFGYMSPEQAEGQPVDLRTDIFSMGTVLWELLANDRLFIANNEINTLRKIRDCQIPSLRKINPNIHAELERIVHKALARDRNLRYQTSAAMHRDLNRYLNRQFPDFSPHDFSVFVKTLFADEILETRRRLIEYAKVNFDSLGVQIPLDEEPSRRVVTGPAPAKNKANGPRLQNLPDPGKIVPVHLADATGTETETESESESSSRPNTFSNSNIDFTNERDAGTNAFKIKESTKVDAPPQNAPSAQSEAELLAKKKLKDNLQALVQKASTSGKTAPPTPDHRGGNQMRGGVRIIGQRPSSPNGASSQDPNYGGIDENALAEVMRLQQGQEINGQRPTDPGRGGEGQYQQQHPEPMALDPEAEEKDPSSFNQYSSYSLSRYTSTASMEGAASGKRGFGLLMGAVVGLLIYAFAVKFYPNQMSPVMNLTEPILGSLHKALGSGDIQLSSGTDTLKNPEQPPVAATTPPTPPPVHPVRPPTPPQPEGTKVALVPTNPTPTVPDLQPLSPDDPLEIIGKGGQAELLITSTPSGAEIYLNAVNTGKVTPSKITVPSTEKFLITLKRTGYIDYERKDLLRSETGRKLAATLQKALVGYLNIDVIPPRAVKVFVNGQRLSGEMLPIYNYAVPAETWVVVRAVDPLSALDAEEKVFLSRDQKKSVTLYLKKAGRNK
ncbi:MAG: serine/threonine protein kinase [Bdellovibrionales bacterium]|nr:serine/threonine protein kinase [Bdellovibrionales bacterium]